MEVKRLSPVITLILYFELINSIIYLSTFSLIGISKIQNPAKIKSFSKTSLSVL